MKSYKDEQMIARLVAFEKENAELNNRVEALDKRIQNIEKLNEALAQGLARLEDTE